MSTTETKGKYRHLATLPLIFLLPDARADAIIPYMVVPWGQAALLPVVVIIEALILRKLIGGRFIQNIIQSIVANIASTLIGGALYLAIMPFLGKDLFEWSYSAGFSAETFRSACVSLAFATILWFISWQSEAAILIRMRNSGEWHAIKSASAKANLVTYGLLLSLAVLTGRTSSDIDALVDTSKNSSNIELQLKPTASHPYIGFWRAACTDDYGYAFQAANDGKYTIAFCGPGGCTKAESLTPVRINDNPEYRIVDSNTIEKIGASKEKIQRCGRTH